MNSSENQLQKLEGTKPANQESGQKTYKGNKNRSQKIEVVEQKFDIRKIDKKYLQLYMVQLRIN